MASSLRKCLRLKLPLITILTFGEAQYHSGPFVGPCVRAHIEASMLGYYEGSVSVANFPLTWGPQEYFKCAHFCLDLIFLIPSKFSNFREDVSTSKFETRESSTPQTYSLAHIHLNRRCIINM